ncbi:MAG: hypothetical protein HQK83_06215 [Fibrobacteria bacterium]|nr:hypothetical protein [Fibrobacteria bacterium]
MQIDAIPSSQTGITGAPAGYSSWDTPPPQFTPPGAIPKSPRFQYSSEGYHYQKEELNVVYKNKDGDSLEISYSAESLNAFSMQGDMENSKDIDAGVFKKLDEFIKQQKQMLLDYLFGNKEHPFGEGIKTGQIEGVEPTTELNIPEYWNAENTSQRIVDFATSFFSMSDKGANEFGTMMMEAVKKGFEEASAITGQLPGAAGELVADTQQLTMEKLEAWMAQNSSEPVSAIA